MCSCGISIGVTSSTIKSAAPNQELQNYEIPPRITPAIDHQALSCLSIYSDFPGGFNSTSIFGSTEKIFLGKVGKKIEHQGRCKICSRIEWKHSQPLKITLRHTIRFFSVLNKMNLIRHEYPCGSAENRDMHFSST